MGFGKNIYNDIDLIFSTQQAFDSFSRFFLEELAHSIETPILHRISQWLSLKYMTQ